MQTEKRVLPGYVLVNMDLGRRGLEGGEEHPRGDGLRGRRGTKPVPLSRPEVDRILRTGTGTAAPARPVEFPLGEAVKITSGPLADFDGEIVEVNADVQKLKVLVDIFERQVPVELGFDQVKKLRLDGEEGSPH